jgi:hypothetical protein
MFLFWWVYLLFIAFKQRISQIGPAILRFTLKRPNNTWLKHFNSNNFLQLVRLYVVHHEELIAWHLQREHFANLDLRTLTSCVIFVSLPCTDLHHTPYVSFEAWTRHNVQHMKQDACTCLKYLPGMSRGKVRACRMLINCQFFKLSAFVAPCRSLTSSF